MKKYFLFLTSFLVVFSALAQTARNLLPRVINVPNKHQVAPALSGDGKTMIFMTNYSSSGKMELKITRQTGSNQWSEPELLGDFNKVGLDQIGAYSLSYDGNIFLFTTKRSPGIGGFDIFMVERKGDQWTAPQNIGKPVNSDTNDGFPFLAPDNKTLYFARCLQMDLEKCSDCKILKATRKNSRYWNEPEEITGLIESGDITAPRILMDNETLIFAARQDGNSGGYDLYQQNLKNPGRQPMVLDYLNTERDDLFVSVPATGEWAYYSALFRDRFNLIVAEVPEKFQPEPVMAFSGQITDEAGKPVDAVIQINEPKKGETLNFARTDQHGNYFILSRLYPQLELTVKPLDKSFLFENQVIESSDINFSKYQSEDFSIRRVKAGGEYWSYSFGFYPCSSMLQPVAANEIRRWIEVLKANPGYKLEMEVYQPEIRYDSLPAPELTEVIADTIYHEISALPDSLLYPMDSIAIVENDTLGQESVDVNGTDQDLIQIQEFSVKYIYHNDRTDKMAESIISEFLDLGVPFHLVSASGGGDRHGKINDGLTSEVLVKIRLVSL